MYQIYGLSVALWEGIKMEQVLYLRYWVRIIYESSFVSKTGVRGICCKLCLLFRIIRIIIFHYFLNCGLEKYYEPFCWTAWNGIFRVHVSHIHYWQFFILYWTWHSFIPDICQSIMWSRLYIWLIWTKIKST